MNMYFYSFPRTVLYYNLKTLTIVHDLSLLFFFFQLHMYGFSQHSKLLQFFSVYFAFYWIGQ